MTQNWTAAKLQRHAQQLSPAALATVAAVTGVASPETLEEGLGTLTPAGLSALRMSLVDMGL